MDRYHLKKVLAGLSIATLITGAGLTFTGCATTGSGEKSGCKCKQTEGAKTSCSGQTSCSGKTSCSGSSSCSGKK
jgi:radical SAM modification target selenobiotic family peptide